VEVQTQELHVFYVWELSGESRSALTVFEMPRNGIDEKVAVIQLSSFGFRLHASGRGCLRSI
jgi:hypothetical protein